MSKESEESRSERRKAPALIKQQGQESRFGITLYQDSFILGIKTMMTFNLLGGEGCDVKREVACEAERRDTENKGLGEEQPR